MSATDLRFSTRLPVTTDLRFGLAPGAPGSYNTGTVAAGVTVGTHAALTTQTGYLATLAAAVDVGLQANLSTTYDNAVNRAPYEWARSAWEAADRRPNDTVARHEVAPKREHNAAIALLPGEDRRADLAARWDWMLQAIRPAMRLPWAEAAPLAADAAIPHEELLRHNRPALVLSGSDGAPLHTDATDRWIDLFRTRRPSLNILWAEARRAGKTLSPAFGAGRPIRLDTRIPWQEARRPPPGVSAIIVIPPGGHVPCYHPIPGEPVILRFKDLAPASLDLLFRCPNWTPPSGGTVVIPILRSYIVHNDILLKRTDNNLVLPALALSLSIDADSWCWGWSASLPAEHLDNVLPSNGQATVEFEAVINGVHWLLLGEKVRRDRRFGSARIALSGRGRAAWLADPYAAAVTRTNAEAMTAQQLMADALTENGVSIGWDIDWQITDWLVPAGAWSHTGTAMDACLTIAAAAGAYIQAHRTSQILSVLPRYPSAPWTWASVTPDIQIPEDVCVTEGIEWLDKPDYNTVFISGQTGGILAHVTRGGTAGDKPAQMITDPLITHADAGRQRGTAVLADTGRQKLISLSLPVLPETGIIVPGRFVRYNEGGNQHIGLTRAVEVLPDFPKLRQTITVESHVL